MSLARTDRAAILCAVFSLVAMLVAANSSNGEPRVSSWPGVRGPNWDGRSPETEIAERWPASGPPVLWTRELGEGYSSFAAWDDRVATMYQTASTQYVVCLDAKTGRTIWETACGWAYERGGRYPGPRATPTFSAGRLYYATPLGLVGCLDSRSGRRLWAVHLQDDLGARLPGFGYSCSPTVVDDMVVLPAGGANSALIALDAATGEVRWRAGD